MLNIIQAPRTDELQRGDAVVWNSGEVYLFERTEPIDGSDYVHVFWDGGIWSTTAQPWNTWTAAVRSA